MYTREGMANRHFLMPIKVNKMLYAMLIAKAQVHLD